MAENLGKIKPQKIPASQAIPGNAEHAKLIRQHQKNPSGPSKKRGIFTSVLIVIACLFLVGVVAALLY